MEKLLTVVIPCHNEINSIEGIVRRVINEKNDKEIIIVDDGSTDGSSEMADSFSGDDISVIHLSGCHGKGYAVRQGISAAKGKYTIIQDADSEYDPEEYDVLLHRIIKEDLDAVYGNRFHRGRPDGTMISAYLGNRVLTLLTNIVFGCRVHDMETCYKLVKTKRLQSFVLDANTFTIEVQITAKLAKAGCKIGEEPISYHPRGYKNGKKINYKDFFKAVCFIARERFQ